MTSTMTLRSAACKEEEGDERTSESDRMTVLEQSVIKMSSILNSITLELKKINDSVLKLNGNTDKESKLSPTDGEVKGVTHTDIYVINNTLDQKEKGNDENPLVKVDLQDDIYIDKQKDPMNHIKMINHLSLQFPKITLPENLRKYDALLQHMIDIEQKFAFHGVHNSYKVNMFVRTLEGSEILTEFFRHTTLKKIKGDCYVTSTDIETWVWIDLKHDFIQYYLDKGAVYIIIDKLQNWNCSTFNSIKKSIEEYERTIKYISLVNQVNGGEVNINSLENSYKLHFLRTVDSVTYSEVIQSMEINNRDSKLKVIHDLTYKDLVKILINICSKREIAESLYVRKNCAHGNSRNQGYKNELSKSDVYKKMPCHQFAADKCNLGEKCLYSHDKNKINEYKKSIGEKVENK